MQQRFLSSSILLMAALGAALLFPHASHAAEASLEDRVKAAFIFNFLQFTEWPRGAFAKPEDPLVLGIVGNPPIADLLKSIAFGKAVNGHAILVSSVESPADAARCNALFVAQDPGIRLDALLQAVRNQSVLTVGDPEHFADAGGIIRFYLDDNKVRFEINTLAAERAHLQISSKLLKLARIVRK